MSDDLDRALNLLHTGFPHPYGPIGAGFAAAGVRFAAIGGPLDQRWRQAVAELAGCVRVVGDGQPILCEGGVYPGAWIESTATICTEVLDRFAPEVTAATHRRFIDGQREDGLIPYKVTDLGPAFSQIQLVTPFARSVWRHYRLAGGDLGYLRACYDAMARMDGWLVRYRNTRGTGGVEAFCTFDTGHDLSPRFWHVPDRCFGGEASRVDPSVPWLPYVAPDLTANVACQRDYLALIAAELGEDPQPWRTLADASRAALWAQCFDEADRCFYDRDASGGFVRVQSDVLLRVLACEIGDGQFFADALERYLLNTRKFLSHYGFTSLALDDPRFDHDHTRNSWGGPVNFLAMLRAPEAFERHGHVAELAYVTAPVLAALADADRFPQCLDPWTGAAGFTSGYAPAILWFLDAVERTHGILPRPDDSVWLTALPPRPPCRATAYSRTMWETTYELLIDAKTATVLRAGEPWLTFPAGWRVELDADGQVREVVGCSAGTVSGVLRGCQSDDDPIAALELGPNEAFRFDGRVFRRVRGVKFVPPRWGDA